MPLPPHKNVTALDFRAVERQITEIGLVIREAEKYTDPASQRHAAFLAGAVQALTWVAGGPAGSELYSAQLEGEKLARLLQQEEAIREASRG